MNTFWGVLWKLLSFLRTMGESKISLYLKKSSKRYALPLHQIHACIINNMILTNLAHICCTITRMNTVITFYGYLQNEIYLYNGSRYKCIFISYCSLICKLSFDTELYNLANIIFYNEKFNIFYVLISI